MTKRQASRKKSPKQSDENATVQRNNSEVKKVKLTDNPVNKKQPHITPQTVNRTAKESVVSDALVSIGRKAFKEAAQPEEKPKKIAKRKTEDGQPDSAIKATKHKRIKRRKFKIGCEHVDFIAELGYKQYIQLAISNVFRFLSDKEVAATFCVSRKWSYVLNQNAGISKRRAQYVERQVELRRKFGTENWPIMLKKMNNGGHSGGRRVLGEMTNRKAVINR